MAVNSNGTDNTLRQRQGSPTKFVVTEAGREADKRLDKHERWAIARFEFCQ